MIIADSKLQCLERGEIHHAIKHGIIEEDDIQELGSLINTKKSIERDEDQVTIADLTGVAVQDIQIAKAVYEACERKN